MTNSVVTAQLPAVNVLVVEDSTTYAAWVSSLLRQEAKLQGRIVNTTIVTTLSQALASLTSNPVDAVLLDLNLPDCEGIRTVAALTDKFPDVAVVVISAVADENTALRALGNGAEEYVFKGREKEGSVFRALTRSIERKIVQQRLANAEHTAQQNERMAAVGLLASGVAHEYNNIGAVILGNAEVLLSSAPLSDDDRSALVDIRDAAKRANAVTQGLLNFVRGFREPMSPVGLHDVVLETMHMAQAAIHTCDVKVTVDAPSPQPYVMGNASILGQVLLNLVINACHAMQERPVRELSVKLSTDGPEGLVQLAVSDTGTGISEMDLPKVFLPFFSTKGEHSRGQGPTARQRGSGLGLTISESFVKQHGGSIAVTSARDKGSIFTVTLPAVDPNVQDDEPQPVAQVAVNNLKGRRVLVVDDDAAVRRMVMLALGAMGIVVEGVDSVMAAFKHIENAPPALVLIDWQMPGANGGTLVAGLMEMPQDKRPAMIVVSGNLALEDEAALKQQGVPILAKPFGLHALREAVTAGLLPP
jgi:signal transduction histidine kinase